MGGLVNKMIFPRPKMPSYSKEDFQGIDRLFWIKTQHYKDKLTPGQIPVVYMPYLDVKDYMSTHLMIVFHANAEDVGQMYDMAYSLRENLRVNMLLVEYCGYGVYKDLSGQPSSQQIEYDSQKVYEYAINELRFKEEQIILFGRSIGTGVCCHLGALFAPRAVILLMPFTSIREMASIVVKNSLMAKTLVADMFNNVKNVQYMKPDKPILVIHGEKDDLVPLRHSQIIFNEIVKKDYPPKIICRFHVSETMTHNALNYKQDLADPIKNFFKDNQIVTYSVKKNIRVPFETQPPVKIIYKDLLRMLQKQQGELQKQVEQNRNGEDDQSLEDEDDVKSYADVAILHDIPTEQVRDVEYNSSTTVDNSILVKNSNNQLQIVTTEKTVELIGVKVQKEEEEKSQNIEQSPVQQGRQIRDSPLDEQRIRQLIEQDLLQLRSRFTVKVVSDQIVEKVELSTSAREELVEEKFTQSEINIQLETYTPNVLLESQDSLTTTDQNFNTSQQL